MDNRIIERKNLVRCNKIIKNRLKYKKILDDKKLVENSIEKLMSWIESVEYKSYDPYDFWGTKFGILIQRYRYILPFYFPLQQIEKIFPKIFRFFIKKNLFATSMAQIALSYFRLYELKEDKKYLKKGKSCLNWLKEHSTRGFSGYCWGLPFDWQMPGILAEAHTPCSTIVPYMTDAFIKGYKITGKKTYLSIAISTANFIFKDLNREEINSKTVCLSYTPKDNFHVINANSYSAKVLYKIGYLINKYELIELADKILNYILAEQNDDGSWFYWGKQQQVSKTIDSLHQCYILENLYEIYKMNYSGVILKSLTKGYKYFKNNLLKSGYPKFAADREYPIDINSCAETIFLMTELSDIFLSAKKIVNEVISWTICNMQDDSGFFYYRINNIFGKNYKVKIPYIRWGQAPMLNALTNYLHKFNGIDKLILKK